MTYTQPADEWDFVPAEDEPEDDVRRAAEVAALHVESAAVLTPARDPSLTDVAVDGSPAPAQQVFFEDEEPEEPPPAPAEDHEPDLEELLESQHYAFEPEQD